MNAMEDHMFDEGDLTDRQRELLARMEEKKGIIARQQLSRWMLEQKAKDADARGSEIVSAVRKRTAETIA